ncbi:MAG: CBS domain-containing protein [Tunicatimonas sp.]|uniref:CBS domain-containing protein n=1 Tax=Tunicatimonas sp. TaxID=1940096 RepID=UPI003C7726C6
MKISASLYSNQDKSLKELVQELDALRIDSFHIDCNDNPAVFDDIREIRQLSKTPIDLHIISAEPEKYFPLIAEHQIEYVQFQYETMDGKELPLPPIGTKYGLAIISDTPLEVFASYRDVCSFILLMTTTPGKSGGVFRKDNFNRIRRFGKQFPDKKIHVDGGVNDEVSFILRSLAVDSAVSGSFLVNHTSMGAALLGLKMHEVSSHYRVKDFMIDLRDVPQLPEEKVTLASVLQTIEDYGLGFTTIVDSNNRLVGISSNADVRRALITHLDHLPNIPSAELVNSNPVSISEEATVEDMLKLVTNVSFPILFLPVVNQQQQLTGTLMFNNLIRSEG